MFPILRVKKDDDLQELKSKSGELDSNQFRDVLIIRLLDHMKDMFQLCFEPWSVALFLTTAATQQTFPQTPTQSLQQT